MIKFQIEDQNPAVLVGLVKSSSAVCLTLNGIKVAFISPGTGILETLLVSYRDEDQLRSLGIQMKDGRIAVA